MFEIFLLFLIQITLRLQTTERSLIFKMIMDHVGCVNLAESTMDDKKCSSNRTHHSRHFSTKNGQFLDYAKANEHLIQTSLFYMHLFFLIGCFGWLFPLIPRYGHFVACRVDGSARVGEPQIK